MDPNANLAELRRIVERHANSEASEGDYSRALDLVEALDDWIARGGFLPSDWQAQQKATA
jgi:hypothetical protein